MLPSDIEIQAVHLHDFVKQILDKTQEGFTIKSYDQSVYMPQHNSVLYYCVMSAPEEKATIEEKDVEKKEEEAVVVEERKRPMPPIRRKSQ